MDNNADVKRILLASHPADWKRQLGRPRITWLSTVQQDLKQHHLTLSEAADLAQNRPLWRMMSTYGATQYWVACQKWRRTTAANFNFTGSFSTSIRQTAISLPPISAVWFPGKGWWIWHKLRVEVVEWTCYSDRTWNAEVQTELTDYKTDTHQLPLQSIL